MTRTAAVDTIARPIALPHRAGVRLDAAEAEAIANDVVFGVMGASVLK